MDLKLFFTGSGDDEWTGLIASKERSLLCSLVVEHENKDDFVLLCSPGSPE